jgi:hypothetical protein
MLRQTFDLVTPTWKNRERQRRLMNRAGLPCILALGVLVAVFLWVKSPGERELTIGLLTLGYPALVVVFLLVNHGDPVSMSISGSVLTFTRQDGRSFSVEIDRRRAAAALLDQSRVRSVASNPKGTFPPYLVSFGLGQDFIPLSGEAHAALLQALPQLGLTPVKSGPDPLQRRAIRHVYRRER